MRISKIVRLRPMEKKSSYFYPLIIILFLASVCLGFLYSEEGTFVMGPEHFLPYDIKISENASFTTPKTRLEATTHVNLNPIAFDDIDLDQLFLHDGQFIDENHTYLAYSFYIKNMGEEKIDVTHYMRFIEVSYWMVDALKILVIEEDSLYTMYQKEVNESHTFEDIDVLSFTSTTHVYNHVIEDLNKDDIKHYRVIMWLDQTKIDDYDQVQSGILKLNMHFRAAYASNIDQNQSLSLGGPKALWIEISTICSIEFSLIFDKENDI